MLPNYCLTLYYFANILLYCIILFIYFLYYYYILILVDSLMFCTPPIVQFGGVHLKSLQNLPDGTFDIAKLRSLAYKGIDPHFSQTGLVCIENTHNLMGGRILPPQWQEEVRNNVE